MIKFNAVYAIIILHFVQCTSQVKNNTDVDTTNIIHVVFNNAKQIDNHLVPSNTDTIYLIKNQYFNRLWPKKAGRFTIIFIENSAKARQRNNFSTIALDKRIRLDVPLFKISADSANLILYNLNFGSETKYYLKKQGSRWIITKVVKGME